VIFSQNYLVTKALSFLVNQLKNANVVSNYECFDDLDKILERDNPDFIIVSGTFDIKDKMLLKKLSSNSSLIGVNFPSLPIKHLAYFDLVIDFLDEKNTIIDSIIDLIERDLTNFETEEESEKLSSRELDVLKQVALGKTNKEIAERLFISQHTVVTHRKNITSKLGIKTISGLTVYAILNNIIQMEEVG
jgi:DNA-binding CsgD family transcriptional regulator